MEVTPSLVISVVTLLGSGLAWLLSDARSKGRLEPIEPKVKALEDEMKNHAKKIAESEVDRASLRREIERVDREKAGRDVVDGIAALLRDLKADIENRFDKLENKLDGLQARQHRGE